MIFYEADWFELLTYNKFLSIFQKKLMLIALKWSDIFDKIQQISFKSHFCYLPCN